MILTSSFLPVRYKQLSGTAGTNMQFINIIKSYYDDHAGITGIFLILRDVYHDHLYEILRVIHLIVELPTINIIISTTSLEVRVGNDNFWTYLYVVYTNE